MQPWLAALVLLFLAYETYATLRCSLIPENIVKPRSRIDTLRYQIHISGNPTAYVPEEIYTVYLHSNPSLPVQRSFKEFTLVLEHEDPDAQFYSVGELTLSDSLTTFSKTCRNAIIQTNPLPKPEIEVTWRAPPSGSGCVVFRATVVESSDMWFSEEGDLIKKLCEENEDSKEVQPPILQECCACQEAKYEVVFEGLWARNTFPNNFPDDEWKTKFSDLVGASHSSDYAFWSYENKASEGLKELAENGNTKLVEDELKEQGLHIRTIIKAKGLSYPNTTGRTYAAFRVDNQHHLMSVVTSIIPSPDWFVGVSSYELCTEDCSWIESAEYNLYPWDAGTDDGITYTSPDQPSKLEHSIRRIQSNSPNDPRSPFFDPEGSDIKPLGKLYLTRQKLYDKDCDYSEVEPSSSAGAGAAAGECDTEPWSDWSTCSVTCGEGSQFRARKYINEDDNRRCRKRLIEYRVCQAFMPICPENKYLDENDPACHLTPWSEWSSCSVTCGKGTKTRDRKYSSLEHKSACQARPNPPELQENDECYNGGEDCTEFVNHRVDEVCSYGQWTDCNVTCGTGYKIRFRLASINNENEDECDKLPESEVVQCTENCNKEAEEEQDENEEVTTIHPSIQVGNQMAATNIVTQGSSSPVVHCKVSKWSQWSRCEPVEGPCGRGYQRKTRVIRVHASNGGRRCPKRLMRRRPCNKKCPYEKNSLRAYYSHYDSIEDPLLPSWGPGGSTNDIVIDCVMSNWSEWSPCSQTCGLGAVQTRTRQIKVHPSRNGKPCPQRVEKRVCLLPIAC